jgi:hypothetical protein
MILMFSLSTLIKKSLIITSKYYQKSGGYDSKELEEKQVVS